MSASHLTLAVLLVCSGLLWTPAAAADVTLCTRTAPCVFSCGGATLDLTPLSRDDNQPRFPDVIDHQGMAQYSFSPCSTFSEGAGCNNTSVCQVTIGAPNATIDVGSAESLAVTEDAATRGVTLTYTKVDGASQSNRTTHVLLKCGSAASANDTGSLDVTGETAGNSRIYDMTLTSQYACLQASPNSTTENPLTSQPPATNTTTEPPTPTTPSEGNATTENPVTSQSPVTANTTSHGGVTSEASPTTGPPPQTSTEVSTPATTASTTPGGLASTLRFSMLTLMLAIGAAAAVTTR